MMTQAAFPKLFSSQIAFDTACIILDGFNKHIGCFAQLARSQNGILKPGTGKPRKLLPGSVLDSMISV
jgi:hypothetical protein